jgi:ABC-type amino acid transport substrate-binding protein
MFKRLLLVLAATSLLFASLVRAEERESLVLLTENFPPYNMADGGSNYAKDEKISGIAVELVREMFKRLRWKSRAMACSAPRVCLSGKMTSSGSARLARMTGLCWRALTALSA